MAAEAGMFKMEYLLTCLEPKVVAGLSWNAGVAGPGCQALFLPPTPHTFLPRLTLSSPLNLVSQEG